MTEDLQRLLAVKDLVAATLPAAEMRGFDGDAKKPQKIGAGGCVIGHPGEHDEIEVVLSPLTYCYEWPIRLEIAAADGAGGEPLDAVLAPLGLALLADPTLGGLVEHLTFTPADRNDRTVAGLATSNWAVVEVVLEFSTTNPLG